MVWRESDGSSRKIVVDKRETWALTFEGERKKKRDIVLEEKENERGKEGENIVESITSLSVSPSPLSSFNLQDWLRDYD